MATSTFRNKNKVRPKKGGAAKRRRGIVQRRRLQGLGLSEEQVGKLQVHEVRALLKNPVETQKRYGIQTEA